MAASEVAICRLALAHLGDRANVTAITPPDGSYQAEQCSTYYPIARDEMLESYAWTWAKTRVALAQLALTPPNQWAYTYAYPSNCLRILSVQVPGAPDDNKSEKYIIERNSGSTVIYCNLSEASARYIASSPSVGLFPPKFTTALSWLLASYLAGPITKSPKIKESCFKMYMHEFAKAMSLDAGSEETGVRADHVAPWISERA